MKKSREYLVTQTKDGYNRMAKDWSGTRMNFWVELTDIVRSRLSEKNTLLDLGCGNARFYREISDLDISYTGCDISEGLIEQAHKYHPELPLSACDARDTPYPDANFNMIVSFAVIHHLPGKQAQQQFFDEVYRLLKPGGTAIISTWNIWKTRKKLILKQYLQNKFRKKSWELGDTIMDFTHHESSRFVHGFSKNRLRTLSKKSGFIIEQIQNIHRASKKGSEENIVLILRKK